MKNKWTYCVLDEGHLLKNPKTLTAKAARKLCSEHRLILSGTPIQNNVHELWSAFDWLMPNYLGNEIEFTKNYGKSITKGNLPGASSKEIRTSMERLKSLHQKVLPFILRRKKEDVLKELPSKTIIDIPCTMTEVQQQIYSEFCEKKDTTKALELLDYLIHENDNKKIENEKNSLQTLVSLRMICTHPALVNNRGICHKFESTIRFDVSGKLLALNDLLRRCRIYQDEITAVDNDVSLIYLQNQNETEKSSTAEILHVDTDNGIFEQGTLDPSDDPRSPTSKCLIFSQYSQSLDALEELLFKPHMPLLEYVRLDGKTSSKDRAIVVASFQTDPSIKCMLLTSKVGSLGLNLQAADTVIFLENDWNPFVDLQAMDRCHRIGQKHNVKVYRLVTTNSIEEKVIAIQKVKVAMSDAVVNTENTTMYSMGTDRLLDLFTTLETDRNIT
jgi:TATA-binding protein-associated factor